MALRLFQELYYLAHSENLGSIVERGIFSHALVGHTGVQHVDISQPGAQQWRALPEPVFGCAIHEYVPLYFNPRNPMLFVRRHQQRDLVVLRVSVNAVKAAGQALFTDGNAASRATRFSTGFGVVKAATPVLEAPYWSDFHDGRRMRCAEALVVNRVEPHFIEAVACNNLGLARRLQQQCGLQLRVGSALFFWCAKQCRMF